MAIFERAHGRELLGAVNLLNRYEVRLSPSNERTAEKVWNRHYGEFSSGNKWQQRRPSRVTQLKLVEQINGLVSQLSSTLSKLIIMESSQNLH